MPDVRKILVSIDETIFKAVKAIQQGHEGIALVIDSDTRLLATITDGDIRRAILDGIGFDETIATLVASWPESIKRPITAPQGTLKTELLDLMREKVLRQIPLVDEDGRVVDLALLAELIEAIELPLEAVVMAGGFGKRLQPLTVDTPKPMLPLQGRPLMERTIEQLRETGITKIRITTHHKPEVIMDYFGDGSDFGVDIGYVKEDTPLGTAGALGLLGTRDQTSLVINGDIMTQLDFRKMLDFHHGNDAVMTVGIRKYEYQIPYGVVEIDGVGISALVEKPDYTAFINAGVYLLEPETFKFIPHGRQFDMTDLIQDLIANKLKVIAFPIQEYWLDIGQPDDYDQAVKDAASGKL